jgi:hypothetical protein
MFFFQIPVQIVCTVKACRPHVRTVTSCGKRPLREGQTFSATKKHLYTHRHYLSERAKEKTEKNILTFEAKASLNNIYQFSPYHEKKHFTIRKISWLTLF